MLENAFVNTLVVTAYQYYMPVLRKLPGDFVREKPPLGRKQNNRQFTFFIIHTGFNRLYRFEDGLRLEHHAGAAAVRIIVGGMVFIMSKVAYIHQVDINQPVIDSPLENAEAERRLEQLRK